MNVVGWGAVVVNGGLIMRPLTLVLALALAAPLAVLAQNPMQRPAPPPDTPKIGPSPTSGAHPGPVPPLRDNRVVLNPVIAPPAPPVVQVVTLAPSHGGNAHMTTLLPAGG